MRKRVIVTTIEEMQKDKKPQSCFTFTVNNTALNITPVQDRQMLVDLREEMHSSRIANAPKDHYFD